MIIIGSSKVRHENEYSILECPVTIDGLSHVIWFSVERKYGQYLCHERSDGFLIAVLNYAMRNKHDITCEAPVTEELYYNIDKYLLEALVKYNAHFYRPVIQAPIATDSLPCAGAVGTGVSCGVDSLHAICNQTSLKFQKHNISHLSFNNVGSHGEGERASSLYAKRLVAPRKFAEEYGFEFVPSDSNLMDVIKQNHFLTHTYSSMFPVFCLQKLYAVYYYASAGYAYDEFSLVDKPSRCSGSYELLSLPLFSTRNLRIYSEGEGKSRLEKIKSIMNFAPAHKYLNVCLSSEENCGKCEKCVRTLLALDALDVLDSFKDVFDVEYYKKHTQWYLSQLLIQKAAGKHDYYELYPLLKSKIDTFTYFKFKVMPWYVKILCAVNKISFLRIIKDAVKTRLLHKKSENS